MILTADFSSWVFWLDTGLALIVFSVILFVVYKISKRKIFLIPFAINIIGITTAYIFRGLSLLTISLIVILLIDAVIFLFVNIASLRPFVNNLFMIKKPVAPTPRHFDSSQLIAYIVDTVAYLSKTKTGAIIAIERKSNLSEFIKNGTPMNAPVSPELLMTIFYPGTRLHDGAVVVRNNMIIAASVYFPPTTKPLSGKYGSRHRAALGISEVSDAVIVVVSEETGRISIAYNGELEPVFIDQFKQLLIHYMEIAQEEKES
jgi:diadenylate cyclase